MQDCNDHEPKAHGDVDLRREAMLQALLLQRSAVVEHRERVGHSEGRQSTVGGAYLSMLPPIAGPGMVEHALRTLRDLLSSGSVDQISQSWSAVERCLTEEEAKELRPQVLNRLFPEDALRRSHARHGDGALGGC